MKSNFDNSIMFVMRDFVRSLVNKYLVYVATYRPEEVNMTETFTNDFLVWLFRSTQISNNENGNHER